MKLLIAIILVSGELLSAENSMLAISPALSVRVVVADFVPSVTVTTLVSGSIVTVTVVYSVFLSGNVAASNPAVAAVPAYNVPHQ